MAGRGVLGLWSRRWCECRARGRWSDSEAGCRWLQSRHGSSQRCVRWTCWRPRSLAGNESSGCKRPSKGLYHSVPDTVELQHNRCLWEKDGARPGGLPEWLTPSQRIESCELKHRSRLPRVEPQPVRHSCVRTVYRQLHERGKVIPTSSPSKFRLTATSTVQQNCGQRRTLPAVAAPRAKVIQSHANAFATPCRVAPTKTIGMRASRLGTASLLVRRSVPVQRFLDTLALLPWNIGSILSLP